MHYADWMLLEQRDFGTYIAKHVYMRAMYKASPIGKKLIKPKKKTFFTMQSYKTYLLLLVVKITLLLSLTS